MWTISTPFYILNAIAMKGVSKPLGVRSIIAVCYRTLKGFPVESFDTSCLVVWGSGFIELDMS
jgi:hypothetical protein